MELTISTVEAGCNEPWSSAWKNLLFSVLFSVSALAHPRCRARLLKLQPGPTFRM